MFRTLDRANDPSIGELSRMTRFLVEHSGRRFDDTVLTGMRIGDADPLPGHYETPQPTPQNDVPYFWRPLDEWELD